MKPLWLLLSLSLFFACVFAWDDLDHEIFDLVSDIEASEGKGTTFYSWLDVPQTATTAEISKAYRRKSLKMHPDKNPGVKNIQKRFARLGVVAEILRNNESREKYDFFFKNGVPKWRGTGYYYSRYRPGLGSVFVFLISLSSGLQYLIQRMNYKRDLARIQRFVASAKAAAWGPKMIPLKGQRRVKVNMGGGYVDDEDDYIPGKMLNMVVDEEDVYILEPDGSLLLLDESATSPASISSTWFVALLIRLFRRARGVKEEEPVLEEEQFVPASDSASSSEYESATKERSRSGTPVNGAPNGVKRATATTMAAGKRRKPKKKKI